MLTKRFLTVTSLIFLLLAIFMMLAIKGMLFHTMAGPTAPLVPHYYNYLHPAVYFGAGMYPAPAAVILSILSAIFSTVTLLRKNKGKASFAMTLSACIMAGIVLLASPFTFINLVIFLMLLAALAAAYWAVYKAQNL